MTCSTLPFRRRSRARANRPQNHQFDFWLGEWDVTQPTGKAAGHNRITSLLGGCALREEWTGASGSHGTSLNAYDPAAKRWRQTWVDDSGTVLVLEGQFQGGKMTLQGELPGAGGPRDEAADHVEPSGGRHRATALGVVERRRTHVEDGVRRDVSEGAVGASRALRCRALAVIVEERSLRRIPALNATTRRVGDPSLRQDDAVEDQPRAPSPRNAIDAANCPT